MSDSIPPQDLLEGGQEQGSPREFNNVFPLHGSYVTESGVGEKPDVSSKITVLPIEKPVPVEAAVPATITSIAGGVKGDVVKVSSREIKLSEAEIKGQIRVLEVAGILEAKGELSGDPLLSGEGAKALWNLRENDLERDWADQTFSNSQLQDDDRDMFLVVCPILLRMYPYTWRRRINDDRVVGVIRVLRDPDSTFAKLQSYLVEGFIQTIISVRQPRM